MLKTRVIPTLLWKNFGLVKGIGFNSWRRVGSLLPAVKVYNTRQVDELILLDISASLNDSDPDFDTVAEIAYECFVPLTFGGGIKTTEHIKRLLRLGADKVSLNTICYSKPELITEAAGIFGSQCVVVSIDVKEIDDRYRCFSHSGTKDTGFEAVEWAVKAEAAGAGEILLTDIQRDGLLKGYNFNLIKAVSEAVSIPVIASGGASNLNDFVKAVKECGASAVAAASIFHFTEMTPLEIKGALKENNIPIRKVS